MNSIRGERFNIDLDSDDELEHPNPRVPRSAALTAFDFISDVKERAVSAPKPPSAPTPKSTATGFPAHRDRSRVSAFKQQRARKNEAFAAEGQHTLTPKSQHSQPLPALEQSRAPAASTQDGETPEAREKREIDAENRKVISQMSEEEIERERAELFAGLNPALLERFLKRANIDDRPDEENFDAVIETKENKESAPGEAKSAGMTPHGQNASKPKTRNKSVAFAQNPPKYQDVEPAEVTLKQARKEDFDEVGDAMNLPHSTIHFPRNPQPPDLDPSDPSFNEELHEKYFPDLAYDPNALSWMSAPDPKTPSSYDPSHDALPISALRFSFKGQLIPPTKAAEIPVTEGLHHHGDAPEAAGYTLGELARLARSSVATQRCIAYQTLGRFLYRLGVNEFGTEGAEKKYNVSMVDTEHGEIREEIEDEETERATLAKGLWEYVEELRITDILVEEANKDHGHLTARTYAQEAVWNWKRGGGRKRKAV